MPEELLAAFSSRSTRSTPRPTELIAAYRATSRPPAVGDDDHQAARPGDPGDPPATSSCTPWPTSPPAGAHQPPPSSASTQPPGRPELLTAAAAAAAASRRRPARRRDRSGGPQVVEAVVGEARDLAALEPARRSVPAAHGAAVRDHRRPRSDPRPGRRCRRGRVAAAHPTRPRRNPRGVAAQRRQQRLPSPARRRCSPPTRLLAAEDRLPRARRRPRRRPTAAVDERSTPRCSAIATSGPRRRRARRPGRRRQDHRAARSAPRLGSRARPGLGHRARALRGGRAGPRRRARHRDRHHRQVVARPQPVARRPARHRRRGVARRDAHPPPHRHPGRRRRRQGAARRRLGAAGRRRRRRRLRAPRPRPRRHPRAHPGPPLPPALGSRRHPATPRRRPRRHRHLPPSTTGCAPATTTRCSTPPTRAWRTDLAAGRAQRDDRPDPRHRDRAQHQRARNDRIAAGDVAATRRSRVARRHPGLRRRRRRDAPQRPPPARRPPLGPQRRPLDRHRHPPRRRRHRARPAAAGCTARRLRRRSTSSSDTPARSSRAGSDRRHRPRHRATRHDPRSPLRRADPRPRRQHRLRHRRRRPRTRPSGPDRRSSHASAPSPPPTTPSATSRNATPPSPSSPPSTRPSRPARNTTAGSPSSPIRPHPGADRRGHRAPTASPGSTPNSAAPKPTTTTSRRCSPALVAAAARPDAGDVAAALHDRLRRATTPRTGSSRPRPAPRLIAGLIPQATGPMPDDMRDALAERQQLIEQRARTLADTAIAEHAPWTRALGPPPRDPRHRDAWHRHLQTIAAYRDRYGLNDDLPLGRAPATAGQRADAARAHDALIQAQRLAADTTPAHPARAHVHEARNPQRSL